MNRSRGVPPHRDSCCPQIGALGFLIALSMLCLAGTVYAAEYYVAPGGSDSNPGSIGQPFATLQKGAAVAVAGDTVFIRGGTYSIVTPAAAGAGISFSKSGTSDTNRIKFWAYTGEVPIFDFSRMVISTSTYTHGFVVTGNWLHFKGIEIRNVPMNTRSNNAIAVSGASNDVFELMNLHHNSGTGIFIGNGTGGHLILNCDSHDNYDPTSTQGDGQNADGFGLHYQATGPSSTFRGCRAWWNSDDGYDFISQEVPALIENCWAMGSGYINSGTARPGSGNGNGFKIGSSKTGVRHIVRNNLAWGNAAAGFYANHSSGGNDWYNNTSYNNGTQYNMLASPPTDSSVTIILSGTLAHRMRNNIGFPNKNSNMGGVDTMFNTWDLNIVPSASDFVAISDAGFMGPRQPDGSLPALGFMKLRPGSQLIDKGGSVALPFVGAAPDLGAFEYGATPATGAGGATGAGANAGGAGSAGIGVPTGTGGQVVLGSGGAGATMRGTGGTVTLGTGGSPLPGGATGSGGAIGGPGANDASSGCACAVDARPPRCRATFLLLALGALAALRMTGKRRRRIATCSAASAAMDPAGPST